MSRIEGRVVSPSSFSSSRLVRVNTASANGGILTAEYDSHERVLTFAVPSGSREDERMYLVEVDTDTWEIDCARWRDPADPDYPFCETWHYRKASKNGREKYGHHLELLAHEKGYWYLPVVLRGPSGLCPHCRKVRAWLMRHGFREPMEARILDLTQRLLKKPDVQRRSA